MKRRYRINRHNSTACGYPGRDFDWSKFCWDGSEIYKSRFKGVDDFKAPLPWVDDSLIAPSCQYLHVPYDWQGNGTIYRVRPHPCMYAGEIYRGKRVVRQRVVQEDGNWYWELETE